jgi:hypothetical protein
MKRFTLALAAVAVAAFGLLAFLPDDADAATANTSLVSLNPSHPWKRSLSGSSFIDGSTSAQVLITQSSAAPAFKTLSGDVTVTAAGVATVSGVEDTSAPAVDTVLTAAQSGTTFYIATAGVDLTLPAPAAGLRYRFVVTAAFDTTAMTIVTNSSANVIYGAVDVNSTLVPCSAEDTITFAHAAELPGDFVEVRSDGTNWYVSGMGATAAAITCTQAS